MNSELSVLVSLFNQVRTDSPCAPVVALPPTNKATGEFHWMSPHCTAVTLTWLFRERQSTSAEGRRRIDETTPLQLQETAMDLLPEDHEERSSLLSATCVWNDTDPSQDIGSAVCVPRAAVDVSPPGQGPPLQSSVCPCDIPHLGDAISALQRGFEYPSLPTQLRTNTGAPTLLCSNNTGNSKHVDGTVVQTAIKVAPVGYANLPKALSTMGDALMSRFLRSGCLSDRDRSISAHQCAVKLTGPSHPSFASSLHGLAQSLHDSSRRTGHLSDIEAGIILLRKAIKLTPEGHERLSDYQNDLQQLLQSRSDSTNYILDTPDQVSALRKAVGDYPGGDKDILINLLD